MKLVSNLAKKYIPEQENDVVIHAIQHPFHMQYLENPIMSTEAVCPMCDGKKGLCCLIEAGKQSRVWFCVEPVCLATVKRSGATRTQGSLNNKRSLEWPLFCELNNLGDMVLDVAFEKVDQSNEKKAFLLKFAQKPNGIILMKGPKGTGKTYASLGLCEMYTRNSSSCLFYTQDTLAAAWMEAQKTDRAMSFRDKIHKVNLLIIDDFGLREAPAGFMQFFMSAIDTRMQWSTRGTVISTNLNDDMLSKYCGDSLIDRLNTGQPFHFNGKSRRTLKPL